MRSRLFVVLVVSDPLHKVMHLGIVGAMEACHIPPVGDEIEGVLGFHRVGDDHTLP